MKKIVIFALLLISALSMSLAKGKGIPRPRRNINIVRPERHNNINDKGRGDKCIDNPECGLG